MATAITSLAVLADAPVLSEILISVAVGAFIVLGARLLLRLTIDRCRVLATLDDPATALDSLTIVAAAGALTARLTTADASSSMTNALAGITVVAWLVLVPGVARTLSINRHHRNERVSGNWLLIVVATQALATVAALTARTLDAPAVSVAGVAAWIGGIALYAVIAPTLAGKLGHLSARRCFTPDYWIAMGAPAITTLAATTLLTTPAPPLRPLLEAGGIVAWVAASAWIPLLAALDVRANITNFAHVGAARWSTVFPLGMYAAAAQALGRVDNTPTVTHVGEWASWIALAAWTVVAIATSRRSLAPRGMALGHKPSKPTG